MIFWFERVSSEHPCYKCKIISNEIEPKVTTKFVYFKTLQSWSRIIFYGVRTIIRLHADFESLSWSRIITEIMFQFQLRLYDNDALHVMESEPKRDNAPVLAAPALGK
jgi:hypothetical protein